MASPITFNVDLKNKGITIGSGNDKVQIGKDGISVAGIPIIGKKLGVTGEKPVLGPLSALDLNKYKSNQSLMYPMDIDKYLHKIKFNINIPERSKYRTDTNMAADSSSTANMNKGTPEPTQVASGGKATAVAAAYTVGNVLSNIGNIATSAIRGFLKGGKKGAIGAATVSTVAAAGGGLVKGAVSGVVLNNVNIDRKTKRLVQTIHLYIPDTVQSVMVSQYDAVSLTEATGNAGFVNQGVDASAAAIKEMIGSLNGGPGANRSGTSGAGFKQELLGKLGEKSGQFGGDIGAVLQASTGLAINPAIEVLFKAIAPREFQFDFKFTPKNQQESEQVLNIIKAFRFHAAPEFATIKEQTGRYLIPPSEFDIEFLFGVEHNPALPKLSTCVLEGIDVNYVTAGQFATYEDGMPIEIAMQLRFKEVETLHKDLIADGY